MLTILLDGLAYGMLLFALACGLSVTLGLMNFINLAHGALAMIGGYVTALLMNRAGVPFLATLPAAFVIPAILGVVVERKPTMHERMAWGEGDGSDLIVFDRPYGRLSGLSCWEHQMVLPGYALIAQGTQFHVGCWPGDEPPAPPSPLCLWVRQHLLSRAFAAQAGCYVICAAGLLTRDAVEERFRSLAWFDHSGDSVIIDPRGEIIAGPVAAKEEIIVAKASLELLRAAKVATDTAGHYSRRDVFDLTVRGVSVFR